MSVFISYRRMDRVLAYEIARNFDLNNIEYYLDIVDEESLNTDDITTVITDNIKKCTHLLAIVSANTRGSWWVPFEIGEATITNCRICSFAVKNSGTLNRSLMNSYYYDFLPDYLHKWPILVNMRDLDIFIRQYKGDIRSSINEGLESWQSKSESFGRSGLTKNGADAFHNALKMQL